LRWLCPAIVSPNTNGLADDKVEAAAQRRLVLVAKLLQNLSNEVYCESKEEYMHDLNSFIAENVNKLHSFFDHLLLVMALFCFFTKTPACLPTFPSSPIWRHRPFFFFLIFVFFYFPFFSVFFRFSFSFPRNLPIFLISLFPCLSCSLCFLSIFLSFSLFPISILSIFFILILLFF